MFNKKIGMKIPESSSNEVSSNNLCNDKKCTFYSKMQIINTHIIFNESIDNNTQHFENEWLPFIVENDKKRTK